jgi:hypothetical protein
MTIRFQIKNKPQVPSREPMQSLYLADNFRRAAGDIQQRIFVG